MEIPKYRVFDGRRYTLRKRFGTKRAAQIEGRLHNSRYPHSGYYRVVRVAATQSNFPWALYTHG
jgi:hypothetical protein